MQRQAARAALGRRGLALESACATSTTTTDFFSRHPFSTTTSAQSDDSPFSRTPPPPSTRERSQQAAERLGQLSQSSNSFMRSSGVIDARSFRKPTEGGAAGDSSRIISIQSLRGRGGRARGGMGRGGSRGGMDGGFSRFPPGRAREGFREADRSGAEEEDSAVGAADLAAGVGLATGVAGGVGAVGAVEAVEAAGAGGAGKKKDEGIKKAVVYSEAEKAVMDRSEQGIVRDYVPTVQMKDLSGYGAPVATDTTLGQVETALRTMRIMGGGVAFNSDAGVTVDARAVRRRYLKEKKPVFFNTLEEKDWAERASPGLKITMPEVATRKAIVDLTIRGQYEDPGYVDVTDTMGTIANYHNSTFSYTGAHSRAFVEKVQSMLPVDTTARPVDEKKKLP